MLSGLRSISKQTFKNYELIICHDGPKSIPYDDEIDFTELGLNPIIMNTPQRMNDWGHSSRDYAMRRASGDFFLQFNIDNLLYKHALEKISTVLAESRKEVAIFAVAHWKLGVANFSGLPPRSMNIDCLQLVASKRVWESVGYWHDKREGSDGIIYEDICNKYEWVGIANVLGENF